VIGIVVVSHGRLAEELVNAARTIVGEIPAIAAVSIGWSDDMDEARRAIERAMAEVGGAEVLLLTDMFGGTPTNVSLPFLSPRVEIVTGVNLPMLIKLSTLREEKPLDELASFIKQYGQRNISVASEILPDERK
jgi:PTS system mannose-specific IIA component